MLALLFGRRLRLPVGVDGGGNIGAAKCILILFGQCPQVKRHNGNFWLLVRCVFGRDGLTFACVATQNGHQGFAFDRQIEGEWPGKADV